MDIMQFLIAWKQSKWAAEKFKLCISNNHSVKCHLWPTFQWIQTVVRGWRQSLNRWLVQVNPGLMMAKVTILDIWYYCLQGSTLQMIFLHTCPLFLFQIERKDRCKNISKIQKCLKNRVSPALHFYYNHPWICMMEI